MCPSNGPAEEGDGTGRGEVGLDSEKMSNLVDREPKGWQRHQPKQQEADKLLRSDPCSRRNSIW